MIISACYLSLFQTALELTSHFLSCRVKTFIREKRRVSGRLNKHRAIVCLLGKRTRPSPGTTGIPASWAGKLTCGSHCCSSVSNGCAPEPRRASASHVSPSKPHVPVRLCLWDRKNRSLPRPLFGCYKLFFFLAFWLMQRSTTSTWRVFSPTK